MKGWIVIHKIKSLYDNGNGLTERKIAKQLGLSRNTVSKYLHMPESEIVHQLDELARTKKLDAYIVLILFSRSKPIRTCQPSKSCGS